MLARPSLPESTRREALLDIAGDERQHAQLIKNFTTDRFYTTELWLLQKLGEIRRSRSQAESE